MDKESDTLDRDKLERDSEWLRTLLLEHTGEDVFFDKLLGREGGEHPPLARSIHEQDRLQMLRGILANARALLGSEKSATEWLFHGIGFQGAGKPAPFDYISDGEFDALWLLHDCLEMAVVGGDIRPKPTDEVLNPLATAVGVGSHLPAGAAGDTLEERSYVVDDYSVSPGSGTASQRPGPEAPREVLSLLALTPSEFHHILGDDPAVARGRLDDLIRIGRALATLLPRPGFPAEWLRAPNKAPVCGGQSALRLVHANPAALEQVRMYLEAQLYGWSSLGAPSSAVAGSTHIT